MRRRLNPRDNGGVALILALVVILLLTVLVVEFAFETHVEASLATNRDSSFEAYLAARSAVAEGIGMLATDLLETTMNAEPEYDSFWDPTPWAAGIDIKPLNDAFMRASITDEYGKINLNALLQPDGSGGVIENAWLIEALRIFLYMRDPEMAEDPVDAILDWLEPPDMDGSRPGGVDPSYYEALENPYPAKRGPMDSVEELLLVKGMTPRLYFGDPEADPPQFSLSEYLTVHGDWRGRINVNTAPPEVVMAVIEGWNAAGGGNANVGAIDMIIERQMNQEPFMQESELDGIIPPPRRRQRRGQQPAPDADLDDPEFAGARATDVFRVNSDTFRIYGDGMHEDTLVRVEAYVWRRPFDDTNLEGGGAIEPFRILDYKVIR